MNRTGGAAKSLGGTRDGRLKGVDRKSVEEFMGEYKWCFGGT